MKPETTKEHILSVKENSPENTASINAWPKDGRKKTIMRTLFECLVMSNIIPYLNFKVT